jgi:beta-lactamase class A
LTSRSDFSRAIGSFRTLIARFRTNIPKRRFDIPLRELLRLAVYLSDNVAADAALGTIGGPAIVETYMESIGVKGFHLKDGEQGLHRDVAVQYRNWFEPAGAVRLLLRISDNLPLTREHTQLILD